MLRFQFSFAGLLSLLHFTVILNNTNSLRKFHQYSNVESKKKKKIRKEEKTEKQKNHRMSFGSDKLIES